MGEVEPADLITEVIAHGGWVETSFFSLTPVEGMGTGAVARIDIPPHTPLFYVPQDQLLSSHSSDIAAHLSSSEWASLGKGWIALILTMMWETHKGSESRWQAYLGGSMPTSFDTPMFWDSATREELHGTDIANTVGREQADDDYRTILQPVLDAHPELFPAESNDFTLQAYHLQGSRILSRSFTVPCRSLDVQSSLNQLEDDAEQDEDETTEVVMVPIADMLNAVTGLDNARLFSHEDSDSEPIAKGEGYTMITTSAIMEGEQILNTYDAVPNSGLLRKYGHVDILPLQSEVLSLLSAEEVGQWPFGNPADEVSIGGDLVLDVVSKQVSTGGMPRYQARVDRWLDEEDDTFVLSFSAPIDPQLVVFTRLLAVDSDWQRFLNRGKLPSPTVDANIAVLLNEILDARARRYRQTIEDDLKLIVAVPLTEKHRRMAAIIRVGEKRVIAAARRAVHACITTSSKKRKAQ